MGGKVLCNHKCRPGSMLSMKSIELSQAQSYVQSLRILPAQKKIIFGLTRIYT